MTEKHIKLVTRSQPHIETLQVSVQVVRIGQKQMTQAVFRQLKKENLVNLETFALRGIPWGRVHYFWEDCGFSTLERRYQRWECRHYHVVWQLGQELRRCCFPVDWKRSYWVDRVIPDGVGFFEEAVWQEHVETIEALPQLFIAV